MLLQIKAMGTRDKAAGVDFSGVLEQEVEDALKSAAQISMGTEISDEDLENILALCDQVNTAAACKASIPSSDDGSWQGVLATAAVLLVLSALDVERPTSLLSGCLFLHHAGD